MKPKARPRSRPVPKTTRIVVRCTVADKKAMMANAKKVGLVLSEYARLLMLRGRQ